MSKKKVITTQFKLIEMSQNRARELKQNLLSLEHSFCNLETEFAIIMVIILQF